jgi:glycosyltransferase involved in cell wall biosynthesis
MTRGANDFAPLSGERPAAGDSPLVIIATNFREAGETGVHAHIEQWRRYLEQRGTSVRVVTPFSWNRALTYPVFSPRLVLKYVSQPASVIWYRYWHELFLRKALRQRLAQAGDCVVYAQGPSEAKAALRARQGKHQRVIMAVHFRASQADEYAEPGREIKRGSAVFRAIRRLEREVIMQLDGLVYVSEWARDALLKWLPEAAAVPSAVIGNAVAQVTGERPAVPYADLVTVGRLDAPKNHRFLLEVLAEAKSAGRRVTLDIFGDGPLRNDLKRRISELGLAEQVRLRGFRSDVRTFLPSYRAYVHASYLETSSFAIIEAMAAGLPIVAGDIGPISELCNDGVEARFWPLDSPSRAATILVELLDSESALLAAGQASLKRFHSDFDVEVVGARIRSFLLGTDATDSIRH